MPASPTPALARRAFTLVELLVVIGIIALLISILLPSLNRARESAKLVACLSNMRQISTTTGLYLNDNKQTLPDAFYNNAAGISPKGTGQPVGTPIPFAPAGGTPVTIQVVPSIGTAYEPYLGDSTADGVWQCPSAAGLAGSESTSSVQPYVKEGNDPYNGTAADDKWIPNYFYVNSKTYTSFASGNVAADRMIPGFPGTDWTIRNIAGLRATAARSVTEQGSTAIVTFVEYKSNYHTTVRKDVYQLGVGEKTDFAGNYAYLDGHGQTQRYKTLAGYMSQFSAPIPQRQYGVNFAGRYADFFLPEHFYTGDSDQPVP